MLAKIVVAALQLSLILVVFGTGASASGREARYLLSRPKQLGKTLLAMNVLMPLLVLVAVRSLALHPAVKIALFTLAISPVPPLLPRQVSSVGVPHHVLSLLLTTSVLAVLTVPLSFAAGMALLGHATTVSVQRVFLQVLLTVLAPFGAGMLARHLAPALLARAMRPLSLVANALLAASVIPILITASGPMLSLVGNGTLLAFAVFATTALFIGHRLGGPEPSSRAVLAIATASRHPGIALVVAQSAFPTQADRVLPALLAYLIVESLVSLVYVRWLRRRHAGMLPGGAPASGGSAAVGASNVLVEGRPRAS
jgi:bile acid:Na+ symporter, BASS family